MCDYRKVCASYECIDSDGNCEKGVERSRTDDCFVDTYTFGTCPDCGKKSIRAKEFHEGGGVVCMNKDCSYWFCY